jgi:hypothetical protein
VDNLTTARSQFNQKGIGLLLPSSGTARGQAAAAPVPPASKTATVSLGEPGAPVPPERNAGGTPRDQSIVG